MIHLSQGYWEEWIGGMEDWKEGSKVRHGHRSAVQAKWCHCRWRLMPKSRCIWMIEYKGVFDKYDDLEI